MTRFSMTAVTLACLVVPLVGQDQQVGQVDTETQSTVTIGTRVGLPPTGYQAVGRRDPFAPLVAPPTTAPPPAVPVRRGPGLAGQAFADVELKGIISSGKTRLALLEGADGKTYLARVQDRLHDAVVRRIDSDAVVLLTTSPQEGGGREVRKPLRPASGGGGL
jgi:Tfp pilus assembly protein PilP